MIDEAYVDFGAQSAITLIDRYPNLLVVHDVEGALARGMRVGFAFGDAALIDALNRVKDSFNSYPLDRLAQVAAQAAYEDTDYFNATCRRVIDSRSRLTRAGRTRLRHRAVGREFRVRAPSRTTRARSQRN